MKALVRYLTIATLAVLAAAGCNKKGAVNVVESGSGPSAVLTVTNPYPTASGESWSPIVAASRYYIKGLNLTVKGTCGRGIDKIRVDEGAGNYPEETSCPADGVFYWSKTYTATVEEGNKTLTFQAYDVTDTLMTGVTATVQVRVDNTAPNPPTVTDPATQPYTYNGAQPTYLVQGTCDPDVVSLTGHGGATLTPVANAWSQTITVTAGATANYDYYAWDLAGNQSPVASQTISWYPQISPRYAGAYSGGASTDGGTGFKIEASSLIEGATAGHAASGFGLLNGFNHVINKVRAD